VAAGTTLLLTTQYLEEADRLADRIAVIDHGVVIERGTADDLKSRVGGSRIDLTLATAEDLSTAVEILGRPAGEVTADESSRRLTLPASDGAITLSDALLALRERGIVPTDASLAKPSLDDVFLTLTGRATADDTDATDATASASTGSAR